MTTVQETIDFNVDNSSKTTETSQVSCVNADPIAVANTFVDLVKQDNYGMKRSKLQRLVYLVAEDYLKTHNEQLFAEPFLVWGHGPVLSSLHYTMGSYSIDYVRNSDGELLHYVWQVKTNPVYESIMKVWRHYGRYTLHELCELTKKPNGAWDEAFQNVLPYFQPKLVTS